MENLFGFNKFNRLHVIAKEMNLKKKPIPFPLNDAKEIYELGQKYEDPRGRLLLYWLYLTGHRVTEALTTRRRDVTLQTKEGKNFMVVRTKTLKNRNQPLRFLPIPFDGNEKQIVDYVWSHIDHLSHDFLIFSNISRTNAWNITTKVDTPVLMINPKTRNVFERDMPLNPHYMRHCRASHLVMFDNYDIYKLMVFFGWQSATMATIYASLNWQTLAEPFLNRPNQDQKNPLP